MILRTLAATLLAAVVGLSFATWRFKDQLNTARTELVAVKQQAAADLALYNAQREAAEMAYKAAVAENAEKAAALKAAYAANRRLTDENLAASRLAADGIRERLRNAPALPSVSLTGDMPAAPGLAAPAGFAAGSIGALLRGQAEPLVGEAERANLLRAELKHCRAVYGRAREVLGGSR